ncbi:MAG: hypothetical protein R3B09_15665 [Nannocystaceae bacterium]
MERLLASRTLPRSALAGAALAVIALGGCAGGEGESTITASTTTTTTTGETESESESESTTEAIEPPAPKGWEVMLSADQELGSIFSVWADGPETIMAVGGQPLAGVVLTLEGDTWARDETLPTIPRLSWIHGIGDFRAAVGYFGVIARRIDGAWIVESSPIEAPLWGVWGASPDDLWVVGGGTDEKKPLLLHYDGGAWAEVDILPLVGDANALYKIWGRAADDIYAVGARGVILHWDGLAWSREEVSTTSTLIGVDGDDDEVIVAGGRSTGIVLRKVPGGEWTGLVFPEDEGFDGALLEDDGRATVVGRRGFVAAFASESLVYTREESGVDHEIHSVYAVPGGPVLAVGGHFDVAPYTGVILRRIE